MIKYIAKIPSIIIAGSLIYNVVQKNKELSDTDKRKTYLSIGVVYIIIMVIAFFIKKQKY